MRDLQKTVIHNIAAQMSKKELTLGSLASKSGLDKSYLSKILRNQRRMNIDQLDCLAKVLGLDPAELLKSLKSDS
jgi:transcriptional regulator with XRE-family HTH domain